MKLGKLFFCIVLCLSGGIAQCNAENKSCLQTCSGEHHHTFCWVCSGVESLIKDAVEVNYNLFSINTVKIITAFTPLYITTRMIDERVHKNFHDREHHKDINKMPSTLCKVVGKLGDVGIIAFTSLAIFAPNEQVRTTARIFGLGAGFALLTKDLIKELHIDAGLRPWCEKFDSKKRSYGGFPSGHMIEATYMTTVLGMQYGLKAAIPLTLFSGMMFAVLVNCNRHYVSQVVAGAAVGVVYGVAANTLINKRLSSDLSVDLYCNAHGAPQVSMNYRF